MDALDLARWQFMIVTIYHFFFVPITIGLGPLVAIMQATWVRPRGSLDLPREAHSAS
jgi:cytochrome d ubiquinol oxidase subunit I